MNKVGIIGHFGYGLDLSNGQTIKTKIITKEISKIVKENVYTIDAHGGWRAVFSVVLGCVKIEFSCVNIIIMLTENGLKVTVPVLSLINLFFNKSLHYIVIGGWLPSFLEKKPLLSKYLKKFSGIYVETNTMRLALQKQGFTNVFVMPNCKDLRILSKDELVYNFSQPHKLCTFSRVMKEKGIQDAVDAVIEVNRIFGKIVYELDIYGQIDTKQLDWFEKMKCSFPSFIRYNGVIASDKSVEVLKQYFALLFPTKFFTEGIPGTIIDAYAAGIPVISARWQSYFDVVIDGVTGIGFEINDFCSFVSIMQKVAENPNSILSLKEACLVKAKDFSIENSLKPLQNFLFKDI